MTATKRDMWITVILERTEYARMGCGECGELRTARSASCPALPNCVAEGDCWEVVMDNMEKAIKDQLQHGVAPTKETPEMLADAMRTIIKRRMGDGIDAGGVSTEMVRIWEA